MARIPGDSPVSAGNTPTIHNLTLTDADTEYSYALPAGSTKVSVRMRDTTKSAKCSFTQSASGTTYFTIDGTSWWEDQIRAEGLTLYLQSSTASVVVEIVSWA